MSFGGESVEIATVTEGAPDEWGIPVPELTWITVTGCRFRPLSATEQVALTNEVIEVWKLTAEPMNAVLNAKPNGMLRYNGVMYEIWGSPQPYTNQSGVLHKVTIMCRRQQIDIA